MANLAGTRRDTKDIETRCAAELEEFSLIFKTAIRSMPKLCAIEFEDMYQIRWERLQHEDGQHFDFDMPRDYANEFSELVTPTFKLHHVDSVLSGELEDLFANRCEEGQVISKVERRRDADEEQWDCTHAVYYRGLDACFHQIDGHPFRWVGYVTLKFDFTSNRETTLAISVLIAMEDLNSLHLHYVGSDSGDAHWSAFAQAESCWR